MRQLKYISLSIILTFLILFICSFSDKFQENGFAIRCYEYIGSFRNLTNTDPDFIQQSQFLNLSNWVQTNDDPNSVCFAANYICRLCFDDTQLGGTVTFQKIIQSLYQYIVITPFYGPQLIILRVGGTNVSVMVYTTFE